MHNYIGFIAIVFVMFFSKYGFVKITSINEDQAQIVVQQLYAQIEKKQKVVPNEIQFEEQPDEQFDIKQLADIVKENTFQTKKLSKVVLESQLQTLQDQLVETQKKIQDIKNNLPQVDDDDECSQYSTCDKCTKKYQCGWCVMEEQCVRGDNIGPLYTSCNFYNYLYCSGPYCIKFNDCDSCLKDPKCGFCLDKVHMMVTCLEQLPEFTGCPAEGWFHREGRMNTCPLQETPLPQDILSPVKAGKKGKAVEPIEKERERTWEEKLVDEKAKILQERQKTLQGTTLTEKGMFLDKARQDLDFFEQQVLQIQEKIAYTKKQLGDEDLS